MALWLLRDCRHKVLHQPFIHLRQDLRPLHILHQTLMRSISYNDLSASTHMPMFLFSHHQLLSMSRPAILQLRPHHKLEPV